MEVLLRFCWKFFGHIFGPIRQKHTFYPTKNLGEVDLLHPRNYALKDLTVSEITPEVVRHLAGLARIDVTDAEVDRFTEQLGLIVDSAATLKAAVAGDVPATSHPIPMKNVYREDVVLESLSQEAALSGSADSESGRFRVAAILDEE
jgi:aspartyl-tRNA(Asn)/glutamyl-tRNA(Gln) amidotransferase subunit C